MKRRPCISAGENKFVQDLFNMSFSIREGNAEDLDFLRAMLYEAAFWRPTVSRPPIEEGLSHPELAKILQDWGRKGDAALVAISPEGGRIGGAWYRFWSDQNHSFGYVGPDIPELGIAVVPDHRGRAVGSALLEALLTLAARRGVERISLSVEEENPARRLYLKHGFKRIAKVGNSWTMVAETGA